MSVQGAPAPAPVLASGVLGWIRNLDIRKVAYAIGIMTLLEQGILGGQIQLQGLLPAAWLGPIAIVCKDLLWINGAILILHPATALKWPTPPVLKALALLFLVGAALTFVQPAAAAGAPHRRHRIAVVPMALPDPRIPSNAQYDAGKTKPAGGFTFACWGNTNFPIGCTPSASAASGASSQTATDPLTLLQQLSWNDLDNARRDALGQVPPNTTAAQCWTYLESLVPQPAAATPASGTSTTPSTSTSATPTPPNPATSLLPTAPGVASAIQKALDDQQLLLTWFSPSGGLAQLNLACAPLINLLNVQIATAGGLSAAAIAAATNPATAPIIAGVQQLLTGAIALAPK